MIVDIDERPDLREQIKGGQLHILSCPKCGMMTAVEAPLLVFNPHGRPVLIFSPADQTTQAQNQDHFSMLLGLLRDQVGATWREEWAAGSVAGVSHTDLPAVMRDGLPIQSGNPLPDELQGLLREIGLLTQVQDMPRRIVLCKEALALVSRERQPMLWAALHGELGRSLAQSPQGDRADNLEQAIRLYQQALEVTTRAAMPVDWATTTMNLAAVYQSRIRGERADNLEQAIALYQQVLEVITRTAMPVDWVTTTMNLATAYSDRIHGERADNLEQAIRLYQQALEVFTMEHHPNDHRRVQRTVTRLHFSESRWAPALQAAQAALQAGDRMFGEAYTEAGRRAELDELAGLHADAAYCQLKLGQHTAALLLLESGFARLLREAFALDDGALRTLPEDEQRPSPSMAPQRATSGRSRGHYGPRGIRAARQQVRELEAELRLPPDTPARRDEHDLSDALRAARETLQNVWAGLRRRYPELLPAALGLAGLLGSVPAGGAWVLPFATAQGGAALVVPHGTHTLTDAHIVWLDALTTDAVQALLIGDEATPGWLISYVAWHQQPTGPWPGVKGFTRMLWDALMGPVHERLHALGLASGAPVVILPQGRLGLLPSP